VAYDGDGDRSMFCDEKGNVHGGDKSGVILADHVLSKNRNARVVTPINSSMMIDIIVGKWNAKITRTKVGSVEVSREMARSNALVGFEENGGFMYGKHIAVRDGAMTTSLMLDMIASKSARLSELMNALPKFYQYKTKFACTKEQSKSVVEHLSRTAGRTETLDGLKIWVNDTSWVMVRQSGTEPVMRLYAESNDSKFLNEMVQDYTAKVSRIVR
jgi:phosphomannomutase/phosphoglucomutase